MTSIARNARGTSLLEAAIVIPMLLLFIGGMVDFGRWFNLHITASRIAYEAARAGASIAGLEKDYDPANPTAPYTPEGPRPIHDQLMTRIARMVCERSFKITEYPTPPSGCPTTDPAQLMGTDITVTRNSLRFPGPGYSPQNDEVAVTVSIPFSPYFFGLLGDVHASAHTPYLYRS